jgi:hypothetical protein
MEFLSVLGVLVVAALVGVLMRRALSDPSRDARQENWDDLDRKRKYDENVRQMQGRK